MNPSGIVGNGLDLQPSRGKLSGPNGASTPHGPDHNAPWIGGCLMAASQPSHALPVVQGVEFRAVPGWPGYCVGNDGTVWSKRCKQGIRKTWMQLKPFSNGKGYRSVFLHNGCSRKLARVAYVVLLSFVGDRPLGMEICHGVLGNADDSISNIRWGTRHENAADKIAHGTLLTGPKHPMTTLSSMEVEEIRRRRLDGESYRSIASDYGVCYTTVRNITKGRTWRFD
jgi:hypothetical protein